MLIFSRNDRVLRFKLSFPLFNNEVSLTHSEDVFPVTQIQKKKKKKVVMKDPKGIRIQKCKLSSSVKDHVPVHA